MGMSELERVKAMSMVGLLDGVVLKLPPMHKANYEPIVNAIITEHNDRTGGNGDHKPRVKVFNYGKQDGPKIIKIGFYGLDAIAFQSMSAEWFAYVDEVHHKTFLDTVDDEAVRTMMDELFHAPMGRTARYTHNKASKESKNDKSLGLAIGDKNSSYEFVFYRRGEKFNYGLEVRIKGVALKPIKDEAARMVQMMQSQEQVRLTSYVPLQQATDKAWAQFWREMGTKNVDLGDYIELMHICSSVYVQPTVGFTPNQDCLWETVRAGGEEMRDVFYDSLDTFHRKSDAV